MQQIKTTLEAIETTAKQLSREKRSWHFHILTKDCMLNNSSDYTLILESPSSEECFVSYCSQKPMELGKQLVQLLHKEDIVQAAPFATAGKIQPCAMNIINRAKELCTKGDLWHHHMLFPDCIFNKHQGKWTIMFEDLENKKIMESISDEEPRSVLREIEILFYKQKNS